MRGPGTMSQRWTMPDQFCALTKASTDVGSRGKERVVCVCGSSRPNISKSSLNQDQAWSTREACKEPTSCQCPPCFATAGTEDEEHAEEKADEIDRSTAKPLTPMWGVNRCEENAEDI